MKFSELAQRAKSTTVALGTRVWEWLRNQPPIKLIFLAIGLPAVLVLGLFIFLFLGVLSGRYGPLPQKAELSSIRNAEASSVFSEDGVLLGKYFEINRTSVPLEEISPYVINGLIATEDARFFEHRGIDLRALARVAFRTVLLGDRSGGGGSTLSQQLAKHLYPRQRYDRLGMLKMKLREMVIAGRLEEVYTKEELLSLYLNTVPFGENAYGIEVAAGRFFSKSAAELNAAEAAVLVGLLKANTTYNPRSNPEASRGRRNVVLALMARHGSLDPAAADSLSTLPIALDYRRENQKLGSAPHFRSYLRSVVEESLADVEHPDGRAYDLDRDGLHIYVTLNSAMQRLAEESVREVMPEIQNNLAYDWRNAKQSPWEDAFQEHVRRTDPRDEKALTTPRPMTIFDWKTGEAKDTVLRPIDSLRHYFTLLNAGLLATEPATGTVRAWVGGVDYNFVQYDHVTAERQVGSTIKPVIYATALERGMLPCEYTPAERFSYEDFNNYNPRNPSGEYAGAYSMRGGLSKSVNTVAVNLAVRSGLDEVVSQIHDMGIDGRVEAIPSVALGTVEASLPEMNTVYATFANGGRRPGGIYLLERIETASGEVLKSFEAPKMGPRVLDPESNKVTTYLMAGVVNSGTAARLRSRYKLRGALAGKTGTTQNQSDGWFLGFTPKLVVGSWVGAEYPAVHFRTLSRGSATATALPLWGTFMRKVQEHDVLKTYRNGSFDRLDEMTLALLDCPDYLEELPVYRDTLEFNPDEDVLARIRRFDTEQLERVISQRERKNNESPQEYAERIARQLEKEEKRSERREARKKFWSRTLFGKKDGGG